MNSNKPRNTTVRKYRKGKFRSVATSDTEDATFREQIQTLLAEKDKLFKVLSDRNEDVALCREKIAEQATVIESLQTITTEYNANKTKLFETLNQNRQLKHDLKLAQRCIHQEIGDSVSVQTLIAAGTTWRGRAQQIKLLQTKLADIQSAATIASRSVTPSQGADSSIHQRKSELEQMAQQLTVAKEELDEVRRKFVALKVRNHNLQDEVAAMKMKCLAMQEKHCQHEDTVKLLNVCIFGDFLFVFIKLIQKLWFVCAGKVGGHSGKV